MFLQVSDNQFTKLFFVYKRKVYLFFFLPKINKSVVV
jgi:hypothetical protein